MEDIETKIDLLLEMYKEDRTHVQSMTSSAAERQQTDDVQTDDVAEYRAPRSSTDPSGPRRSASEVTSSRQERVKPMLRNLSDLGPRVKKRVAYSTCDAPPAVTIDCRRPCHAAVLGQHKPSIVSEEDEDSSVGQQPLSKSSPSDASSIDINSQSDLQCPHRHDVVPHYVTPAQHCDFDTIPQLYNLPTYQITSCNTSPP